MVETYGKYQSWWDNGKKGSEVNFRDGKLEGMCQKWYRGADNSNEDRGQKEIECHYLNDKLEGVMREPQARYQEWWSNGQKWAKCYYIDGKKEGLYQEWYENGKKLKECHYINDQEV